LLVTAESPVPPPLDVSDRPYFQQHRDDPNAELVISPPVALSLYIVASIVKAPMKDANRAIWPFMVVVIGITVAMALLPSIPLWIPRKFGF